MSWIIWAVAGFLIFAFIVYVLTRRSTSRKGRGTSGGFDIDDIFDVFDD